jgi:hypothetical protein
MKYVSLIVGVAAVFLWLPTISAAQDADTIRVDADRIVIVVDDGRVIMRRTDDAGTVDERELRVGRGDRPSDIRIMRRQGTEGDTLTFDIERFVQGARAFADVPRMWMEDFDFADRPLGDFMTERRETARLEADTRELARRARSAEGAERERLEAQLRARLDELLTMRLDIERERVDRLEEQADQRRERLERRMENRGEILERRFRDLMGSDEFEW